MERAVWWNALSLLLAGVVFAVRGRLNGVTDFGYASIGALTGLLVLFFFSLGYGARLLSPLFASPRAWRMLDFLVGLTMWAIAAKLLIGGFD